ncbi:MAG: retroviral-like aspartic protease family protein [Acetobacteraceae bacterium]
MRLLALALLLATVSAARACEVQSVSMVPLILRGGHALVEARIDHHDVRLILDSGAQRSLLTPAAVRRLGLKLDPWVGSTNIGIGGEEHHANALVPRLTLNGMPLHQIFPLPELSLSVGALPGAQGSGRRVVGLLGRDILARYDLDIDLPRRRITLFRVRDCTGRFLPWWRSYHRAAMLPGYRAVLGIAVRADGRTLRAMIDTGATGQLLSTSGMDRLGLTVAGLAGAPAVQARGVGPRTVIGRFLTLRDLTVAGFRSRDVPVMAAPVILSPILDLLIGMNWLARHRVWLSYATGQVFVAGR